MTKEMRPNHRVDVLTDALLFYARKRSASLGTKSYKRLLNGLYCRAALFFFFLIRVFLLLIIFFSLLIYIYFFIFLFIYFFAIRQTAL